MQFGTPPSFLQSSLMQISGRNITIINNYYYEGVEKRPGARATRQGPPLKKTRTEKTV